MNAFAASDSKRTEMSAISPPHNLPTQLTPFIGREREVREVAELLRRPEVRLVTLIGPGGTGKTRLSLQVAGGLLDAFPDGVWFVPLAAVSDPELVAPAIAEALDVREAGNTPLDELLRVFLAERRLLLVLDNFEQVVEAAPIVGELLIAAPEITVLATSRAPLRLRGEQEYSVPPLPLPKRRPPPTAEQLSQYAAVQLFIQRAQSVRPSFTVTNENAPAIAEICHRLDGLPLAIELAAARVKLLSPEAMLSRLQRRLPLLTSGARDLPKRQQTLREAIRWSYDLLEPRDQRIFRVLGAFVGGFSLEAVDAVWTRCQGDAADAEEASALDSVADLVDQSLVRQLDDLVGEPRFGMYGTIQEYARELLHEAGEAPHVQRAHAEYIGDLVARAEPELIRPDQASWYTRLEAEHDNIRAALTFALGERDVTLALRIAGRLWRFWWIRGHLAEGRRWLGSVLALPTPEVSADLAYALRGAGALAEDQSDYDCALALYDQALSAARAVGDKRLEGIVLDSQANVAHDRGHFDDAIRLHRESLRLFEEVGDKRGLASSLHNLGTVSFFRGDLETAEQAYSRSLELIREVGDQRAIGIITGNLGAVVATRGDYERGRELQRECLAVMRSLGDDIGAANALTNLGFAAMRLGDLEEAKTRTLEALEIVDRLGIKRQAGNVRAQLGRIAALEGDVGGAVAHFVAGLSIIWDVKDFTSTAKLLTDLAEQACALGDPARGARLLGAADALRASMSVRLPPLEQEDYDRLVRTIESAAGTETYDAAWSDGAAAPLDETVADALTLGELAAETPESRREAEIAATTGLNRREIEVLRLFVAGNSHAEIAERLNISPAVASAQVGQLYTKLGADSRAGLTAFAFKHGLA